MKLVGVGCWIGECVVSVFFNVVRLVRVVVLFLGIWLVLVVCRCVFWSLLW